MTTALYAGSFDPATYGHLDVIERASRLFDTLVVAIGIHHEKKGEFDAAEREAMLRELVVPIAGRTGGRIEVVTFADLVVDIARGQAEDDAALEVAGGFDRDLHDAMTPGRVQLEPGVLVGVFVLG